MLALTPHTRTHARKHTFSPLPHEHLKQMQARTHAHTNAHASSNPSQVHRAISPPPPPPSPPPPPPPYCNHRLTRVSAVVRFRQRPFRQRRFQENGLWKPEKLIDLPVLARHPTRVRRPKKMFVKMAYSHLASERGSRAVARPPAHHELGSDPG